MLPEFMTFSARLLPFFKLYAQLKTKTYAFETGKKYFPYLQTSYANMQITATQGSCLTCAD